MHVVNLQAVLALGKSDVSLRIEIIKKIIAVTTMVICIHVGLMATAISAIPLGIFALIMNAWPVGKYANYPLTEQLRDAFPAFILSVIMGLCVWLVSLIDIKDLPKLILQLCVGIGVYCILSRITKNNDYNYIKTYIGGYLKKLHKT
jgi:hypothetical protein